MGEMADYLLEAADADVDGVLEEPRKTGGSKQHNHQHSNGAEPQAEICPHCGGSGNMVCEGINRHCLYCDWWW